MKPYCGAEALKEREINYLGEVLVLVHIR